MEHAVLRLLDPSLGGSPEPSWHQEARRDLGIPETCAPDPLVCLSLTRQGRVTTPVAFVLDPSQLDNILTALGDFLDEAFHPAMERTGAVALVDYLPPMDDLGMATGTARRWILDPFTRPAVMREIDRFLTVVSG